MGRPRQHGNAVPMPLAAAPKAEPAVMASAFSDPVIGGSHRVPACCVLLLSTLVNTAGGVVRPLEQSLARLHREMARVDQLRDSTEAQLNLEVAKLADLRRACSVSEAALADVKDRRKENLSERASLKESLTRSRKQAALLAKMPASTLPSLNTSVFDETAHVMSSLEAWKRSRDDAAKVIAQEKKKGKQLESRVQASKTTLQRLRAKLHNNFRKILDFKAGVRRLWHEEVSKEVPERGQHSDRG